MFQKAFRNKATAVRVGYMEAKLETEGEVRMCDVVEFFGIDKTEITYLRRRYMELNPRGVKEERAADRKVVLQRTGRFTRKVLTKGADPARFIELMGELYA